MIRSIFLVALVLAAVAAKKSAPDDKPAWAKKDIRFYSEADMERLLDQWEEDEEPLEPDELPEHLRPPVPIDPNLIGNDPDALLKLSKKGKTLMTFVKVSPKYKKDEVEKITKLWQSSLWNNHIQAERFMVDDNRAIFMYKDGSQAWDAKDFLIQQEDCVDVTIENQVYKGPASPYVQGDVEKCCVKLKISIKMKNFFYVYIIGFLDIASLAMIMLAFNRRLRIFGASHFQITLLESLFSGLQLITSPIVGTLSDRYGRKKLLLLSMTYSVFAYFTMGFCNTYISIAAIRLSLGCFKHTQMLGKSLIGDNVPKDQQLSSHGKLNSFISLAFMIAPVYGGYMSEYADGFYYIACSTSLLCALNVTVIALCVPTKKIQTTDLKKNMFQHLKEVNWVEYWPLLFMRMMYTATLSTLMVSFGLILIENFKLTPSQVGYTISVNSSIGVATGFAVAKLEPFFRKYSSFKKCFFSFILLFFGYVCLSFAPNLIIFMLCMVPISTAGTLIEVFLNQILSETCNDKNRGTLEGATTSSISVARFVTPMVAGLAMDLFGSSGAHLFAALAAISAASLAKFYDGKIKRS